MTKRAECPGCSGVDVEPHDGDLFYCRRCSIIFDSTPDEGGDYDDRDPSWRLQQQERARQRKRKKQSRRRRHANR